MRVHVDVHRNHTEFEFRAAPPIVQLSRELLRNPTRVDVERKAAPAVGITQAVYPVGRELKSALLVELLTRGIVADAIAVAVQHAGDGHLHEPAGLQD